MESAGGLVPQLIAAGVGGGIVVLIGLIGVLIRIFVRLGRLEKAVEGLEAGLKATQGDLKESQKGFRDELNEFRRESQEEFKAVRQEFQEGFNKLRREFREDLQRTEDRLRQEFREELRNTEERLRDLIRSESEATRNEIRRLADALVSHSHDPDGSIRFVIPPQYPGQGSDGAGE